MFQIMVSKVGFDVLILVAFAAIIVFLLAGISFLVVQNGSSGRKRFSFAVLILSICVFISLSLCFYKYTIDDAYISLRYARNLANGYGLVYSTDGSEPIEGYTNFLWVVIETPLFLLNLPDKVILHTIKIIGIIFGIGIIILTYRLTCLLNSNERAGLVAALFTAAIPYLSFWSIGGLETTMYPDKVGTGQSP